MKLIATVFIATFALSTTACGKKAEPAPETAKPAATQPSEPTPTPTTEAKPADPVPADNKPAEMKPAEPTAADLPTPCRKYLDAVRACAAAMPESARGTVIEAMKKTEEAWTLVPKDQMEASCKSAWEAGKQAMAAACPDVKWE